MEKASGSTAKNSSTIVKELKIANYQITFCHFSLCFIELKDFYTLIVFGVIFNEFEDNFVFASNFPGKLSLFSIK